MLVSVCAPKLFADGLPCAASAPVSRASLEDALCRGVGRQGLSPGVRAGGAFGRGVEPGGQPLAELYWLPLLAKLPGVSKVNVAELIASTCW